MKLSVLLAPACLSVLVLPVIGSETAPAHPDRVGFEIAISPVPAPADGHPEAKPHYLVTAVVKQLETGQVIFAPRVYALEGVPARVTSDRDGGVRFKASFLIEGPVAKYTLEETRGDEPLASNAGMVQLSR